MEKKQLTAVFDKAACERRCTGEDRRQKPSQITMFAAGDQTEELQVHDESCGQRLETQHRPLSKVTKGTAPTLQSNAAYYSKWDEGNSSPTFPLTDMRV